MCYTGRCVYETYPRGYNEDCVCVCPKNGVCPMEEANEFQYGNDEKEATDGDSAAETVCS